MRIGDCPRRASDTHLVRKPYNEKKPAEAGFSSCKQTGSLGPLDLAGLHAARADVGLAHMTALVANRDFLDVGLEPAVRHAVRVADVTAGGRLLAANFANLRHSYQLRITAFHHGIVPLAFKLAKKL